MSYRTVSYLPDFTEEPVVRDVPVRCAVKNLCTVTGVSYQGALKEAIRETTK